MTFLTNNMLCSGCKARRKLAARARKKCRGKRWRIQDQDQDPILFLNNPPSLIWIRHWEAPDVVKCFSLLEQQNRIEAQSRLLNLFYDKEPLNSPNIPFLLSKRTSVVSIFYTLYHKARFFNKSECAFYLNFITEMQNKNVLITRTILRVDTTLRDQ